jgi:hypothetical protein
MHAPPIIVLGAPSAAPSRVAAMLGAHPVAIALPELRLFMADTVGELLEIFEVGGSGYADGLLRTVAVLEFGDDDDQHIVRAGHWLKRRADYRGGELLDYFAAQLAPRRLVTVDTETGWHPNSVDRLHQHCPDAQLLQIVNHPRPYCRTTATALAGRLFVAPDYKDYAVTPPVIDPQLAWLRIHCNLQRLVRMFPEVQARWLRIEDLHVAPEPILSALCAWLGWPAERRMLEAMQQPGSGRFCRHGPPLAPGGFDPEFLRAPDFERHLPLRETLDGEIEWRSGGRQFDPELAEQARALGYR